MIIDDGASISQVNSISDEVDGNQLMEGSIEIKANGNEESATLSVLNESSLVTPTDVNRQPMNIPKDGVQFLLKWLKF